jgi:hypothetical protein
VHFIARGGEGRICEAEGIVVSRGFGISRDDAVDGVIVLGVAQVDLVGSNSNNRALISIAVSEDDEKRSVDMPCHISHEVFRFAHNSDFLLRCCSMSGRGRWKQQALGLEREREDGR